MGGTLMMGEVGGASESECKTEEDDEDGWTTEFEGEEGTYRQRRRWRGVEFFEGKLRRRSGSYRNHCVALLHITNMVCLYC